MVDGIRPINWSGWARPQAEARLVRKASSSGGQINPTLDGVITAEGARGAVIRASSQV